MNLHRLLREREAANDPVRVGILGCGKFASMFLAQAVRTPGVHVAAIADLNPAAARANLARIGWPAERYGAADFAAALRSGGTWMTDDVEAAFRQEPIDLVIDSTGDPPSGVRHVLLACETGKSIVMVNVEADALAGPLLARKARDAGIVYSLAYGDQPALICDLVDWARTCGFEVTAAGRGHKWLPEYRFYTPDNVWDGYGLTREQAALATLEPQLADMQRADETVVVCGAGDDVWALVALTDPVRAEAAASVAQIHRQGLRSALLTGDNAATARSVGARVQVTDVRAELLPDGKAAAVDEMIARHGPTAMVGDGINDSQALLRASVGVAMGGSATDVAAESADVVLMHDDLRKLPFVVDHARRARRIIIENITVALGAKAVFLAFMAFGAATLWMAVAADMGASLLVTFNGLRMLRPAGVPGGPSREPALAGAGQET